MSTRDFNELKREVEAQPGAKRRLAQYRRELEAELSLGELRRARDYTQTQLAKSLDTTQPGISRIERQTDLYLSTLRSYVEALGGKLELRASFPEGSVAIESLEQIERAEGGELDDDSPQAPEQEESQARSVSVVVEVNQRAFADAALSARDNVSYLDAKWHDSALRRNYGAWRIRDAVSGEMGRDRFFPERCPDAFLLAAKHVSATRRRGKTQLYPWWDRAHF